MPRACICSTCSCKNPDRRDTNPNCLVVGRELVAIDFETCFSFLYPIVGPSGHAWEVSRHGLASNHLFYRELLGADVQWTPLVQSMLLDIHQMLTTLTSWMPMGWKRWIPDLQRHFESLSKHENELVFEVVRSLS